MSTTHPTDTRPAIPAYIVVEKSAKMPTSCWGRYVRLGLLVVDPAEIPEGGPRMISDRARGVVRVVTTRERCHVGRTDRCAAARARAELEDLAGRLNAGEITEADIC